MDEVIIAIDTVKARYLRLDDDNLLNTDAFERDSRELIKMLQALIGDSTNTRSHIHDGCCIKLKPFDPKIFED